MSDYTQEERDEMFFGTAPEVIINDMTNAVIDIGD